MLSQFKRYNKEEYELAVKDSVNPRSWLLAGEINRYIARNTIEGWHAHALADDKPKASITNGYFVFSVSSLNHAKQTLQTYLASSRYNKRPSVS